MSTTTDELIEKLKTITLFEASELVAQIETTFGVDASAPVGGFVAAPGAGGGGAVEAAEEKTKLFRAHPRPLSKSFLLFLSSTGACAAPVRPSSAGRAAPSARSAACGSRPCSISGCREQLFLRRRRQTARGALEESCKMFFCFFFCRKKKAWLYCLRTTGFCLSPSLSLPSPVLFSFY